ncbi:MAG: LytTR family DNA-binding domain-containing protein [Bacteroidales bacterium]
MLTFTKNTTKTRMLRTLIIDDEPHIRETLIHLVEKYCPQVKVVGEAESVASGIRAIREKIPELVLLDIKMDDGNGFDLLNHFENIDFKVIFITAYEKYAIQAFGFSAIDYLLKPVNPEKLAEAVKRAEQMVQQDFNTQLVTLKENLKTPENKNRKIILKTMENIYLLDVQEIIHCASDGNYTIFETINDEKIVVSKIIKEYDELLSDSGFFRVHRSHLINLKHIRRLSKQDGGYVVMSNGIEVPVSSRGRERLLELFEEIAGK